MKERIMFKIPPIPTAFMMFALAHCLVQATTAQAQGQRTDSLLEIRLAQTEQAPGFDLMRALGPGQNLFVSRDIIISDADVLAADASVADGDLSLVIFLTESGKSRLLEATGNNIGQYLAVLIDGRLSFSGEIRSAVGRHEVRLSLEPSRLPNQAVNAYIQRFNARWPAAKDH
jgi:hypothetical protein